MTLPLSGNPIKMSQVDVELGQSTTTQLNLGASSVRTLFGVASGQIKMSDGYGKSSIAALIAVGWQYPVYSTDGATWTQANWPSGLASTAGSPPGSNGPYQWQVSFFGNNKYIAATAGSYPITKMAASTDGITWTESGTSPINAVWSCGAYGNGVYVIVSNGGGANMITSTDGVNWTSRTVSGVGASWSKLKFANGLFVLTGGHINQARSTDGINWTLYTYSRARGQTDYGNGMWLQLGPGIPGGTSYYYTSTDNCATWTERIGPTTYDRVGPYFSPGGFDGVLYGGGKWVMFSGPYQSAYSTDAINWTTLYIPLTTAYFGTYSARLGLFVIVGYLNSTQRCCTSPDGVTWTARTIPTTMMNGAGPFSVSAA
jgi:hypothetical protein